MRAKLDENLPVEAAELLRTAGWECDSVYNVGSPAQTIPTLQIGTHFNIRGFQIAMDDALLVCGLEPLGNLLRDRQRFVERDRATGDPLRQIVTLNEFHDGAWTSPACSSP